MSSHPLDIATEHYYWKPSASFFRSFELRGYRESGVTLSSPVLDLGCDDGVFAAMLCRTLGESLSLVGADIVRTPLLGIRRRGPASYTGLVVADAARLPFADESFAGVLANGTLTSVASGLDATLRAIRRVLRPGGILVCTVATPALDRNYWLRGLLAGLGLRRIGERCTERWNRRVGNLNSLTSTDWSRCLERAGLRVDRIDGFFPPALARRWSLLTWTPLRVNGLLKLIPSSTIRQWSSRVQRARYRAEHERATVLHPPDESAYLLIRATKAISE